MKLINKWMVVPVLFALLAACGGGGGGNDIPPLQNGGDGGGGGGGNDNPPVQNNVISGTAAKGLITNGIVKVYALSAPGQKGALLATVPTDAQGRYRAEVGTYTGAVLIEASGPYIDEATGQTVIVPENTPLRAALASVGSEVTAAVTPFTELAVRRAEGAGGLDATRVQEANALVSDLLRFDILTTQSVPPTAQALADADEGQKTSTLALATLCQLAVERGQTIPQLLRELTSEIAISGTLSHETLDELEGAVEAFLSGPQNQTGIATTGPQLLQIGRIQGRLLLRAEGSAVSNAIEGIEVWLTLPEGARLPTDADGQVLNGIVTLPPGLAGAYLKLNHLPATENAPEKLGLALISVNGFGPGEFATIDFDMLGSTLPVSGWIVEEFVAVDGNGAPMDGITGGWAVEGR